MAGAGCTGTGEESSRVYRALREGTLEQAQQAVARIVGRDTQRLDRAGVTRAAVETVAENFSDGVAAPLFYFFLGGAPLALCYKAINTLDSMVGYRNERYLYFGRWAARLDDGANWASRPSVGVAAGGGGLALGGGWERCLAGSGAGTGATHASPNAAANRGGDGRSAGGSAGRTSLVFWDTGGKTDHWRASAPDCTRGYSAQ